jgi:hypothetical protein
MNFDVHMFRTRDGGWRARVSWGNRSAYTARHAFRITVMLDVLGILEEAKCDNGST